MKPACHALARAVGTLLVLAASGWNALPQGAPATAPNTVPPGRADDVGDAAWIELLRAMQAPQPPEAWERKAPTAAEKEAFDRQNGELSLRAAEKARLFYTRFPQHPHALESRQLEMQLLAVAIRFGQTGAEPRLAQLEAERLQDPRLTDNERFELKVRRAMMPAAKLQSADRQKALAALEQGVRELRKEFPNRPETWELLMTVAEAYLDQGQPAPARKIAAEVSAGARGDLELAARKFVARLDRLDQPLRLQFTALDGQYIDLQKMRGKVVLVDFWASWCSPCRVAMPDVIAAYERLHARGFEVIGINFDRDRELMTQFTTRLKMPWPQYFDGKGWDNRLGRELDVTSLPTQWLVDKKGRLRQLNARENLAAKVESLLAE